MRKYMVILYRTAKFKSVSAVSIAILGSTTKFNSCQHFQLLQYCVPYLEVYAHWSAVKIKINSTVPFDTVWSFMYTFSGRISLIRILLGIAWFMSLCTVEVVLAAGMCWHGGWLCSSSQWGIWTLATARRERRGIWLHWGQSSNSCHSKPFSAVSYVRTTLHSHNQWVTLRMNTCRYSCKSRLRRVLNCIGEHSGRVTSQKMKSLKDLVYLLCVNIYRNWTNSTKWYLWKNQLPSRS